MLILVFSQFSGYIGALCEDCDVFGKHWTLKYYKNGSYSCAK